MPGETIATAHRYLHYRVGKLRLDEYLVGCCYSLIFLLQFDLWPDLQSPRIMVLSPDRTGTKP